MKMFMRNIRAIEWVMITVGTFLLAVGIKLLFSPAGLVTGGFSGVSIIIQAVSKGAIPLWLSNLFLNAPLFLLALKLRGWKFIRRTLYATVMLSVFLAAIPDVTILTEADLFLQAIYGGIFAGAGMGLVFYAGATTGGTDMMASLIQILMPHYSIAQIMQVLDALIVVFGLFIFGINIALYSIIAIYITAKISDTILEGVKFAKAAIIISDKSEEIAARIMEEVDRGVTGLNGIGMYSKEEKNVLLAVVGKKQIVTVKKIVYEIDPTSFIVVSDVREALGEGFHSVGQYTN